MNKKSLIRSVWILIGIIFMIAIGALWKAESDYLNARYSSTNSTAQSIAMSGEFLPVSMIQLIANGPDYDKRKVKIIGFLKSDGREFVCFFSREDFNNRNRMNALELDLYEAVSENEMDALSLLDKEFVEIYGEFRESVLYGKDYSGYLTNIELIQANL